MRRPLFPVAVAGLAGTVVGLGGEENFWLWLGVAGFASVGAWWGPKKGRTPATWLFVLGVFALYAGARAYAPPRESLRARAGPEGGTVQVEGWVAELPTERVWENGSKAMETELEATSLWGGKGWEKTSGRVLLRVDPCPEKVPRVGEVVRVGGYLAWPEAPRNPGEFDRGRHLRSRGLDYVLKVRAVDLKSVGEKKGVWLAKMAGALRAHMLRATSLGLENDPEASGLIAAMLFGYRDGVGEELREAFRATGTLHLFAVSGQNLAVVAGMLLWILALTGAVKWRWAWATLPAVFLFCLATGMEASAARAFVMTAVLYLGWILGRPMDPANWLGAALLGLLIWDPGQVRDVGFQLSFLVVAGLMILAGPMQKKFVGWGRPDGWIPPRLVSVGRRSWYRTWVKVATVLAASVAAWVGSLIPGILLFHQITPVALGANVAAAPLAGAVTVLAAVSSLVAPCVGGVVAVGVNFVNGKLVHFLAAVLGWMATWPGGHFAVADASVWGERGPAVEIVAVEGAYPTFIQGEGGRWLLEPGPKSAWGFTVRPFLNFFGVNALTGVILATNGARGSGAALELGHALPVGWWGETGGGGRSGVMKAWREALAKEGKGRRFLRAGEKGQLGRDWQMEVFWPEVGEDAGRAEESGLVVRLECNGAGLLWAGAIPWEVEKKLVERYGARLRSEVLVQGPGRGINLSEEWLRTVRPRTVVRSWQLWQDDPSLSVAFAQLAEELGVTLVKLEKSGAVHLTPREGKWALRAWREERKSSGR